AARRGPSRRAAPFAPPRTSSTSWGGARGRGGTALGEVTPESLSPGARRAARDALVERRVEDRPAGAPRGPGKLGRGNRLHADVRVTLWHNRLRGELVPRGFSRVRKVHDTRDPLFEELADCPRDIGRERAPLPHELGAAVRVDGVDGIVFAIGTDSLSGEDVIGRDVHERRVQLAAESRERSHRDDVDHDVVRVGFRGVDARVSRGVQEEAGVRVGGRAEGDAIGDVEGGGTLNVRASPSRFPPPSNTSDWTAQGDIDVLTNARFVRVDASSRMAMN